MAEPARAAMDRDDDAAGREAERPRRVAIEDLGHFLHFEIVIAGAERAHLAPLALLGALRNARRLGALYLAAFFDPFEIARLARIRNELGWSPEVALDEGIARQWEWASATVAAR